MIQEIETKEEFDKFLKDAGEKLVVVDFFATWCGPCKRIAPIIQKWADDDNFKDVVFVKVDVDENEDTAGEMGVSAMPTFILFKDGKKIDEVVGADETKLKEKIEKHK